jgi:hypothetical protein
MLKESVIRRLKAFVIDYKDEVVMGLKWVDQNCHYGLLYPGGHSGV